MMVVVWVTVTAHKSDGGKGGLARLFALSRLLSPNSLCCGLGSGGMGHWRAPKEPTSG